MPRHSHSASFHHDDSMTITAPNGGLAHRDTVAHTARFERRLWNVREGVWCMVGNGLSNQTFVEGPDGLIVIDTGESTQEMQAALDDVREFTEAPVVAVIYTHFHYVGGTAALTADNADIPVWGHERIVANRQRNSSEVGPVARSGLVHQFGITLPDDGPDALVNVGLAENFRQPDHAPFTQGFVAPTNQFGEPTTATIAGLRVEFTPAPSDADDSITIWFPDLSVCVNNIVWPVLFNVFAIRGEEYRDPRILLTGLDHVRALNAEHLVGAHGPPLSGAADVEREVTRSRDAIQFLWDQTVRGINKGLVLGELTEFVQLPEMYSESYLQTQFYGVAEHHVRQIHAGLRGWFDGDEAALFPVPPADRARKLVDGFGGATSVREKIAEAIAADDIRWAIDMATWLIRLDAGDDDGTDEDRRQLADLLRVVAQRTTAANIRNWCLTRARHLDGTAPTDRFHHHRFGHGDVVDGTLADSLFTLRVMLDPVSCDGFDQHLRVELPDERCGLHVRNCVAVPTDGTDAMLTVSMERTAWADVMSGKVTLAAAFDSGDATSDSRSDVEAFFSWFEHRSF